MTITVPTREMHMATGSARQGGEEILPPEDPAKGEVGPVVEVYPDETVDPATAPGPSVEPGRYADSPPAQEGRHRKP
jgi:hypothetical protein